MRLKNILDWTILCSTVFFIQACKKEANAGSGPAPNVYIVGEENGVATYWKNGIATILPGGSEANEVYVSDNNEVYIAGKGIGGATCWLNGVPINLVGGYDATSVLISGNDVYEAGYGPGYGDDSARSNSAKYWKNGVITNLAAHNSSISVMANSIAVSGNDVYVSELGTLYWKNSIPFQLANAYITSVYVSGNDVYFSGSDNDNNYFGAATYWKNGVINHLTKEGGNAFAIFVSGNDLYIAGIENPNNSSKHLVATYWKNGVATHLTTESGYANDIFVYGKDVYVAGLEFDTTVSAYIPTFWKNGKATHLSSKRGGILHSIFVK